MKFVDLLNVSVTMSAGVLTPGAAVSGGRTFAQALADGDVALTDTALVIGVTDGTSRELGLYNVGGTAQSPTLTRTQVLRNNAGGTTAVSFAAGATLTAYSDVPASFLNSLTLGRVPQDRDVPFSQTIPLDQVGSTWMLPTTATSALAFNPGANAVKGAYATVRVTGDGTNSVTAPGFKALSGTQAYDKTSGTVNIFEFAYDGYDYLYAVSQRGTAASGTGDTTSPVMAGALSSSNITTGGFTLTWTAATDNFGVTAYEVSTDGGATYANVGNVLTWGATGKTANTAYSCSVRAVDAAGNKATPISLTVTTSASSDTTAPTMSGSITIGSITQSGYTLSWPAGADNVGVTGYEYSTDGGATYTNAGNVLTVTVTGRAAGATDAVRVRDYDAAGNRGTPLSASVTLATATVPSAPTIGTATAGDTTATVTWTASASNGGSAITGYTATATPGGATATVAASATSATVTGLTDGTAYTLTVHATNAVGNSAESAASNSVTPAAVDWPKLDTATMSSTVTQTGTGPYIITGTSGVAMSAEKGGATTKSLAAGADGWLEFQIMTVGDGGVEAGFRTVGTPNVYTSQFCVFYTSGISPYSYRKSGTGNLATGAQTDLIRIGRFGGVLKCQYKTASGSWTDLFSDITSSSQYWFDIAPFGSAQVKLTGWSGVS